MATYAQATQNGHSASTTPPPKCADQADECSGSPTPTKPSYSYLLTHQSDSPTELQAGQLEAGQAEDQDDDYQEDDDASSCQTCTSGSSTSSDDSLLPARRNFYKSHLVFQFPPTALLVLAAFLSLTLWRNELRWADLLLGAGAWLASEALKELIFSTLTKEATGADGRAVAGSGLALPTLAHAIAQEAIRLGGLVCAVGLLPDPVHASFAFWATGPMPPLPPPTHGPGHERRPLPPLDTLFFSALWFALGWAAVEIVWGCRDFWRRMALYDDVLVDRARADEEAAVGPDEVLELAAEAREARANGHGHVASAKPPAVPRFLRRPLCPEESDGSDDSGSTTYGTIISGNADGRPPAGDRVEEDEEWMSSLGEEEEEEALIDARMRAVEREEVEGQLGVPLFDVPVGVVLVWRVDS